MLNDFDSSIRPSIIIAGKLRRYHHLSILRQLFWPKLVLLNLGDGLLVGVGIVQSIIKLVIWRPDVVFTKGGYVCLPVGLAARLLHIPLVIHDSDAHPGLTNRILARYATSIATGAPLEFYPYPPSISSYVGIPIASSLRPFNDAEKIAAKKQWGIDPERPLIVVTGGGLGAKRINDTVAIVLDDLLEIGSVVLVSGTAQYDELRALVPPNNDRFQLHAFISNEWTQLLGGADVVVTRAGATTILELAALAKPTILIPNAKLTGGHQLKNAAVYAEKSAVIVVNEEEMMDNQELLVQAVRSLVMQPAQASEMAKRLATFARPNATKDMADMIVKATSSK